MADAYSGGGSSLGVLARHVVLLTNKLNAASYATAPEGTVPDWLLQPTDRNLRRAGNYDPEGGRGLPAEVDHGNAAGSALLLAMLLPEAFGVPGAPCLRIFGVPAPWPLVFISHKRATSSVGADSRRAYVVEAMLNDWQEASANTEERSELYRCWHMMRLAMDHVDKHDKLRVFESTRLCLQVPDEVVDGVLSAEGIWWV